MPPKLARAKYRRVAKRAAVATRTRDERVARRIVEDAAAPRAADVPTAHGCLKATVMVCSGSSYTYRHITLNGIKLHNGWFHEHSNIVSSKCNDATMDGTFAYPHVLG